jgi:V-type H+-transporting ATPase subunit d
VLEGDDYTGLYRDVLIDTPVGVYFMRFLEESLEGMGENRTMNDIQALFRDMKPEFIRTSLKRMWLEDMDQFVTQNLTGDSHQLMLDLVNFEADMKTIQVVYNSLGNRDSSSTARVFVLRKQLCPLLGFF